jgi:50S ribosomal subunit-associated GTPase HflX
VPISALHRTNLEQLRQAMLRTQKDYVRASFVIPLTTESMPFISSLFRSADVQAIEYTENTVHVVFEASVEFAENIRNRVEKLNGEFERN